MFPSDQSAVEMMRWPPGDVLARVRRHLEAVDCGEGWQDLAYGCSSSATCGPKPDDEAATWATAAVLVYDRLGEVCAPSERARFSDTGMSLRAWAINELGPRSGDPVRDPAILEDWFFRRLDLPYEVAVSMSENLLTLSTEDFLRLSRLKDRVRLMGSVRPQELFQRIDEIRNWYAIIKSW